MIHPLSTSMAPFVDDPTDPTAPPAARAEALVKVHGEGTAAVRALDGVDVAFRAGRLTAIMGPSGSGKSTLLNCLAGLDRPTSGRVLLGTLDLTPCSEQELTRVRRERIGFVFQAFNLLPMLDARENMTLPLFFVERESVRNLTAKYETKAPASYLELT